MDEMYLGNLVIGCYQKIEECYVEVEEDEGRVLLILCVYELGVWLRFN